MRKRKTARKQVKMAEGSASAISKDVVKGALIGVMITLGAILVLAFLIKAMSLDDSVIPALNQAIKIVSIITAAIVAARGGGPAWLKGVLASIGYVVIGFLLFSLIQGEMGLLSVLFSDILAAAIIGLVSVVLFAMIPKKTHK